LRNSLRVWLTEADFEQAGIESRARAQELSVEQFALLANLVSRRGG
jgi:16S rRNA A1518/A1519 N6-dimethyltransferase RsmA/KsgA/DIM1 with predicted DNA glycosylase/AP lyase activity